jgi:hypothetical protein
VIDFDGIKLRVLHYCDDNGISFELLRDGKAVDQAAFKTKDGWDEVKLITAFNDEHPVTVHASHVVPMDAVTASASGLDPHISVANALLQAPRIAKARSMDEGLVRSLIAQNTEGPDLGILGEAGVNVLRLNLALESHHWETFGDRWFPTVSCDHHFSIVKMAQSFQSGIDDIDALDIPNSFRDLW